MKELRLVRDGDAFVLEVARVAWTSPSESVTTWQAAARIERTNRLSGFRRAFRATLHSPRFFRRCPTCYERNLVGNTLDRGECHGCAAARGVVF